MREAKAQSPEGEVHERTALETFNDVKQKIPALFQRI